MTDRYVVLSQGDDDDAREIGRYATLATARRAAKMQFESPLECDCPPFSAAEGGGYWHPDETGVEAYCDRKDEDSAIAWITPIAAARLRSP